jgi:hypothetical protein
MGGEEGREEEEEEDLGKIWEYCKDSNSNI